MASARFWPSAMVGIRYLLFRARVVFFGEETSDAVLVPFGSRKLVPIIRCSREADSRTNRQILKFARRPNKPPQLVSADTLTTTMASPDRTAGTARTKADANDNGNANAGTTTPCFNEGVIIVILQYLIAATEADLRNSIGQVEARADERAIQLAATQANLANLVQTIQAGSAVADNSIRECLTSLRTHMSSCLTSHNEGLASLQTLLVGVEKKLRAELEAERAARDAKIAAQDAEIASLREGFKAKIAALEANNAALEANNAARDAEMAELRDLFAGISVQEGQDQQQEE